MHLDRRAARERSDRGEGGYVLLAVLAAIAVTSLTIGALFGLMLTTIRVTEAQERNAREARAADGAVVAAINNVRLHQTDPLDACTPGAPATTGLVVPFTRVDGDVTVTCAAAPDQLGPSGGDVDLVGDGYKGAITDWRTAWPWGSASGAVAGVDPSLVHTGDVALPFNGNLTANKGIAAVRSQAGATPAVNVRAGAALQPVAGLGGSGTSCGVLSGPGMLPQTQVVATSGVTCGDPALTPVVADQNYGTNPTPQSPAASCPGGAVVELQPGTYDRAAVATLNTWFNGSIASCKGRTFHFNPGIYSFDANTRTLPLNDDKRFALIFNDPTASFVFGTANGWGAGGATAANFPRACVAGGPGASIVISARTEFRHLAGRLAVCPYTSPEGKAWPALAQSRSVPTVITANTPTSAQFTNPAGLLSGSNTTPATRVFGCDLPPGGTTIVSCSSSASFAVKLATAASGAVTSVPIRVTGDETNYNVSVMSGRSATFDVTLSNGTPCSAPAVQGAPDDSRVMTYDLMAAAGSCDTTITDAALLDGATVQVTYKYDYAGVCLSFFVCPVNAQTLTIWQVAPAINVWTGVAASMPSTTGTDWLNLANVRLDDAQTAIANICPGADSVCGGPWSPPYQRSFQLTNFGDPQSPSAPLGPTAAIDSLGVTVRQQGPKGPGINTASLPGTTTLTLTMRDGTVCARTFPGIANMSGDTYYSLMDQGTVNCGGVTLTAAQLTGSNVLGSSLQVAYRIDCTGVTLPDGTCLFIEPVAIQHVTLNASSNTYAGPVTKAQLNVDAAAGSSANFFGPAYLPHTALDIFWKGTASNASIFGGDLQLYSLGSRMTAGAVADVVCCTAPSSDVRRMVLTAEIDGRPRVSATISINRISGSLEVLEWIRCGRNGDCPASP